MKRKYLRFTKNAANITVAKIENIINTAIVRLFEKQKNIFSFTEMTGQTEWNLAHHLAFELKEFFPCLDCDLDVTKHNFNNKRPDIIFHTRGRVINDFLVIEMKYNGSNSATQSDIIKIQESWFNPILNYKFGAVVNLNTNKTFVVHTFKNPNWEENNKFHYH
ncbi:MAG: hypothetical protein BGO70_01085 [Bacteroidetes bacterium 43-93]|uniref:hypothetical protein n=1 Tax=uncultured Dysgonomonas sp. TaxID=206096 RepID=UPI00092C4B21|nr:hypothetical protein [uncultured Dysgonomonas sp.]MBN9483127.1 hypothetical protein [Bacteroidota bacterium]OJW96306.1 MAG: hypothetical protein BGO70_01085 [Bacteroidetes bacterium 43-93]